MRSFHWGEIMTGDPLELAAYLDWLEEEGECDLLAAREVPGMAIKLLADRALVYLNLTGSSWPLSTWNVCFRHYHQGSVREAGFYFVDPHTWDVYCGRPHPAASLVAHGAYYGTSSAWHPVFRWVEEAVGIRRTACRGIAEGFEVMFKWQATSTDTTKG